MFFPETKNAVELEHFLPSSTPFDQYDQDEYSLDLQSDHSGRIFYTRQAPTALHTLIDWVAVRSIKRAAHLSSQHTHRRLSKKLLLFLSFQLIIVLLFAFLAIIPIVFPSYSNPPRHYDALRQRSLQTTDAGAANLNNEKIFIAASIYDEQGLLAGGAWGRALARLVHILGPDNVFLSIYEDNADIVASEALDRLSQHIQCNQSIVVQDFNTSSLPQITLPNDRHASKRIAFLAEVRNRALQPLDDPRSDAYSTAFDKILYLNDVIYDPIDAANLLLSTNLDDYGRTQYRAACAMDFVDPFKYYDTFASRDNEGNRLGVPIYPWFSSEGEGESRQDVYDEKDAVRVKSCWGGMVAFEAKWFQHGSGSQKEHHEHDHTQSSNISTTSSLAQSSGSIVTNSGIPPLRFRAETELYWDSSECCLIHADLENISRLEGSSKSGSDSGIYMNPYIRVAYVVSTHRWLTLTRRFERILGPFQRIITHLAHIPGSNPRRLNYPGDEVTDRVWVSDLSSQPSRSLNSTIGNGSNSVNGTGHFESVTRKALPGGFCGSKKLLLLGDNGVDGKQGDHGGRWWSEKVPLDLGG